MRNTSVQLMIMKSNTLTEKDGITQWEAGFLESITKQVEIAKGSTFCLNEKQLNVIKKIYNKHF